MSNYKKQNDALPPARGTHKKEDAADRGIMFVNQLIPYFLVVFALFLLLCFVTHDMFGKTDALGVVGSAMRNFFCGLFGASAYVIPFLFAYLGIRWRRFNAQNNLTSKTVFTFLTLIDLSAVIHVFAINSRGSEFGMFSLGELWKSGIALQSSGIIGGFFGEVSYKLLNVIGTSIIGIALLVVYVIFLVGISPLEAWNLICQRVRYVKERARINKEAAAKAAEEREAAAEKEREKERERFEEEIRAENQRKLEIAAMKAKVEEEKRQAEMLKRQKEANEAAERALLKEQKALEKMNVENELGSDATVDSETGEIIEDAVAKSEKKERKLTKEEELSEIFGDDSNFPEKGIDNPIDIQNISIKKIESDECTADGVGLGNAVPEETREQRTERLSKLRARGDDLVKYTFPPFNLLKMESESTVADAETEIRNNIDVLMKTFSNFKVGISEISYSRGPTITRYELKPDSGTRIRTIANLVDDVGLALATSGIRMEAPIPNKSLVGIEVPNKTRSNVYARQLIESDAFQKADSRLWACLGKDVAGTPIFFDISKMPHMLIAGATGMGKSVCINTIIVSLLYKARPDEVKLMLIDPKKVEFGVYNGIPHLLVPVVTDPKKAAGTLQWAVNEMERRFELIESVNMRDIKTYNAITAGDPEKEFMPHIVIIIDELADLMMTAADEVETSICRLAQKARAAGIHLILGTQRPSVDVITGLIKSNIPSRIAFTVASQIDSRTILDNAGAEKLIGKGDMLFNPVGAMKPIRVQGAFISEDEVINITNFIKANSSEVIYDDGVISSIEEAAAMCGQKRSSKSVDAMDAVAPGSADALFRKALEVAVDSGSIATSALQRAIGVGYGRAARIIDRMVELGFVSPPCGNKPRTVLISREKFDQMVMDGDPKIDGQSE